MYGVQSLSGLVGVTVGLQLMFIGEFYLPWQ